MVLKVLTYNVNFELSEPIKVDQVVDAIHRSEADVVLLQETNEFWESVLQSQQTIQSRYPTRLFRHSSGSGGMALLSRWDIEPKSELHLNLSDVPGSWFPFWIIHIKIAGVGTFQFVNVHLRPPVEGYGKANFWSSWNTTSIRLQEMKTIVSHLQEEVPTVIAGDFNESDSLSGISWLLHLSPSECALHFLTTCGYTDALSQFVSKGRETHRWYLKTLFGTILLKKRLDHIFYRGLHPVECVACEVLNGYEDASDHQPVLASFST